MRMCVRAARIVRTILCKRADSPLLMGSSTAVSMDLPLGWFHAQWKPKEEKIGCAQ